MIAACKMNTEIDDDNRKMTHEPKNRITHQQNLSKQ